MGGAGPGTSGCTTRADGRPSRPEPGFAETIQYARLGDPSEVVRKGLRIYDASRLRRQRRQRANRRLRRRERPPDPGIEDHRSLPGSPGRSRSRAEGLDHEGRGDRLRQGRRQGDGPRQSTSPARSLPERRSTTQHAEKGSEPLPSRRSGSPPTPSSTTGWAGSSIERLQAHYQPSHARGRGGRGMSRWSGPRTSPRIAVARQVAETVQLERPGIPRSARRSAKALLPDVFFRKSAKGWELLDHDQLSRSSKLNSRGRETPGPARPDRRRLQRAPSSAFEAPVKPNPTPGSKPGRTLAFGEVRRRLGSTVPSEAYLRIKDDVDVTDQEIERKSPDPVRRPRLEPPDRSGLARPAADLDGQARSSLDGSFPSRRPRAGLDQAGTRSTRCGTW